MRGKQGLDRVLFKEPLGVCWVPKETHTSKIAWLGLGRQDRGLEGRCLGLRDMKRLEIRVPWS